MEHIPRLDNFIQFQEFQMENCETLWLGQSQYPGIESKPKMQGFFQSSWWSWNSMIVASSELWPATPTKSASKTHKGWIQAILSVVRPEKKLFKQTNTLQTILDSWIQSSLNRYETDLFTVQVESLDFQYRISLSKGVRYNLTTHSPTYSSLAPDALTTVSRPYPSFLPSL